MTITRTWSTVLMNAAVVTALAACNSSTSAPVTTTVTAPPVSSQSATAAPSSATPAPPASSTAAKSSAAPSSVALTREPCDLLTQAVAKKYVGDDAQRQLTYGDTDPPVPVGDDACYYTGSTRSVSVEIFPVPTDPTAPVNHFSVIRPENRVEGVDYEAYWFAAGESLVAVKDGLLISVNVSKRTASQTDQDRADDIGLANLIVPQVG